MPAYLIRRLADHPLARHVATVAGGTAAAQGITLACAPLVTRLYGPDAFGVQSVFLSLTGVLAIAAGLGLPLAIVPARDEDQARGLARLSIAAAGTGAGLLSLALWLGADRWLGLIGAEALRPWAWWLPPAVFGGVAAAVLGGWLGRRRAWPLHARWTLATAVAVNGGKVLGGVVQPGAAMLLGAQVVGGLVATAGGAWGGRGSPPAAAPRARLPWRRLLSEHKDYVVYRTPQNLVNALSQALPVLILAGSAGAGVAGQYGLAIAMLAAPAALAAGAVQQVLYPEISDAIRRGRGARRLVVGGLRSLALAGALPFAAVALAGPWLFATVFGADWRDAGVYARLLAAWMFFQFLNVPAVAAVPALGLQRGLLVYELLSTGAKVLALWVGLAILGSDLAAIALFGAAGTVAYAGLIAWILAHLPAEATP